jgi:tetratricopeptide (TPR) repeat protein
LNEQNPCFSLPRLIISFVFILSSLTSFSGTWNDSLWNNWQNDKLHDTVRLKSLRKYIFKYYIDYDSDSTIILANLMHDYAVKKNNKAFEAQSLLTLGQAYYSKGENLRALELEMESYKISESINDKKHSGNVLCNIGNVFLEMGNYADAVEYYTKSMKVAEEIGNKNLVAANLANIGIIYFSQGDYNKAMEYNTKNLKIVEALNDPYSLGYSYRNIGKVYEVQKDYLKAIRAFTKAYSYSEQAEDESGMGYTLNYLGTVYHSLQDYEKALDYFNRSLSIAKKRNDTYGLAENLNHIGNCYIEEHNYIKALEFCRQSFDIASKTELVLLKRDAAQSLYKIYKQTGQYKEALLMHEQFNNIKDTLLSEENRKGVLKKDIQYKYERQALSDSLSFLQKQKLNEFEHNSRLDKERNQRYVLYAGLLFAVILGGMSFRAYQRNKRVNRIISFQKKQVELQKDIVEEKQKEIIDSISYAKRIQNAILPPPSEIKKKLPLSFVFYKPKDIVAGDFYWMETVDDNSYEYIFLAAADCTGHGVPGAMVSVVCSNALNRAVKEYSLKDPGKILDKVREMVIETFNKSDEEVKDGMDISLCSIRQSRSGEKQISWAGANNPLWIVRKKNDSHELLEIKPDKQPIGFFSDAHPFTTHSIDLIPCDTLYLFTDGFQDQFGELSGKKYKSGQMRKLLLSLQEKTMEEQKLIIEDTFIQWKGDFEQVDDVCILAVKFL